MSDGRKQRQRVCIVGSGTTFVSGISYYTYYLARSMAQRLDVSVVLMRRLIPRLLYPGRDRVGQAITGLRTEAFAPTYDGVDWWAVPSVFRARRFVRQQRPDVLILQWWTGSVLLWYLALAHAVRRSGGRIVIEFHEDLDTGEARIPVIGPMVVRGLRRLVRQASAFVVHSAWDAERLAAKFGLAPERVFVVPHGPYPMAAAGSGPVATPDHRGDGATTILFFGTIRPYKGLEHLVEAFDQLPRSAGQSWRLLVVGETWEGWTKPLELIAASAYRADVTVVNRYVTDDEVPGFFAAADIVALPYLRSSASGPLHLTMTAGLPVVVTDVGGLVEAADGYQGAVLVPPADPGALAEGIVKAAALIGTPLHDTRTWDDILDLYAAALDVAARP